MNIRVILITAFFFLFCCFNAILAQSAKIQALEQELVSASGAARVQKLIGLTDLCLQAAQIEKALDYSEEAADLAKKIRANELRAVALNRQGKAFAKVEKKGLFGKNKAIPKFELSNEIVLESKIGNKALLLDNYENLLLIAEKNGKTDEIAKIKNEIAQVKAGNMPNGKHFESTGNKSELKQELSKLEQEKAALAQKLQQQLANQADASKQKEQLAKQSEQLQIQLAEKEEAINKMNEEQMRAELIMVAQRKMLDSLTFKTTMDSISLLNKELAVREAKSGRNFYLAAAAALLLLFGGSFFSFLKARQYNKQIKEEQKRSEDLLLNILPALVAKELKSQGYTNPEYYEDVSVLFADFVGFSRIAEILSPNDLVRELDTCFKAFDKIIQEYNLEKIKTIGDAYMCAGGINSQKGNNIIDMVQAAKAMQNWLHQWNADRERQKLPRFDARIGIHTGPIVAGVVGSKKFAFDIWGDTVNIAARIEQAGEGGKINISGNTYERIKNNVDCQYRGKIEAKNKGLIDMYFVEN